MGVLTKLTKDEINQLIKDFHIKFELIEETQSGITDSTYIGISKNKTKYIFKVFEKSSFENIENKISLLNTLQKLKTAKVISNKVLSYKTKPAILFSYIEGETVCTFDSVYLQEIASFLANLHKSETKITNENIFSKEYLEKMIINIKNQALKKEILEKYEKIKYINFLDDTLIHGDLFPDNAKFMDKKLCGVYDFTQACIGDKRFDLAVVIISWCFEGFEFRYDLFESFIYEYYKQTNKQLKKEIKIYCLYACLYYTSQRISRESKIEDCKEYLKKYEVIEKSL